jgi:hypothetical protein
MPTFAWDNCGTPREASIQMANVLTEIRTRHLPTTSQSHFRLKQLPLCRPNIRVLTASSRCFGSYDNIKKTPELYRPNDRRLSAKLVPTFEDRGCHVVSVTDPYGRILDCLDRSRYFLLSSSWVDPVPDSLLVRKPGSAWNRTRTSGSVAGNSDRCTTEVVDPINKKIYSCYMAPCC